MSQYPSFFMKTRQDSNCVTIDIPGTLAPFPTKKTTINIPKEKLSQKDLSVAEDQKRDFMISLAENNLMRYDLFSAKQMSEARQGIVPQGFQVIYFIPPCCGGSNKVGNCVLIEDQSVPFFESIWAQIKQEIARQSSDIELKISLPEIPPILTQAHLERWAQNNQQSREKDKNRQKRLNGIETQIHQRTQSDGSLLLWLSDHSFVNQPTVTISLTTATQNGRDQFTQNKALHKSICHRDATCLKNLGNNEIHQIKKRGYLPDGIKLQMHHIHPLEWGGRNTADNLCFVSPSDHERFNSEIENPLRTVLATLDSDKRDIYIRLPIPLQAYKIFPPIKLLSVYSHKVASPSPSKPKKITSSKRKTENRKGRHQDKQNLRAEWQYA